MNNTTEQQAALPDPPRSWCCKIDCGAKAEWTIVHGEKPDDYTESCTAHVGELLTNAPEHRIYPK